MYLGIDIGGTKITAANYTFQTDKTSHCSITSETECTQTTTHEAFIEQLQKIIKKHSTPETKAIGIGIAGLLNSQKQLVFNTPNLPLKPNTTITSELLNTDLPIIIENDVNLIGLAEQFKFYQQSKSLLVVAMGTGLGGAIIQNGKIYSGHFGTAAEFGHMIIGPHPQKNAKTITFEEACSGTAIKTLYATDGRTLEKLALKKDKSALEAWKKFGTHLGQGLSNLIHAFNPDTIVLGGSVSNQFSLFKNSTLESIKQHTFPIQTKTLTINKIQISDSGTYGAALNAYLNLNN